MARGMRPGACRVRRGRLAVNESGPVARRRCNRLPPSPARSAGETRTKAEASAVAACWPAARAPHADRPRVAEVFDRRKALLTAARTRRSATGATRWRCLSHQFRYANLRAAPPGVARRAFPPADPDRRGMPSGRRPTPRMPPASDPWSPPRKVGNPKSKIPRRRAPCSNPRLLAGLRGAPPFPALTLLRPADSFPSAETPLYT